MCVGTRRKGLRVNDRITGVILQSLRVLPESTRDKPSGTRALDRFLCAHQNEKRATNMVQVVRCDLVPAGVIRGWNVCCSWGLAGWCLHCLQCLQYLSCLQPQKSRGGL